MRRAAVLLLLFALVGLPGRARSAVDGAVPPGCDPGPAASVNITLDDAYTNYFPDNDGNFVMTGACRNSGTTAPVFVEITIKLYSQQGQNIGSGSSDVYGGSNVLLATSNTFSNALAMGDVGFFKVVTKTPYALVSSTSYNFSYYICAQTAANAQLAFDGEVQKSNNKGYLQLSGAVKNSNPLYLAYCTRISFAVLDNSGKVLDVEQTYIQGSPYSAQCPPLPDFPKPVDTALAPGASQPFSITFPVSFTDCSGDFLSGFAWNETIQLQQRYAKTSKTGSVLGNLEFRD